MIGRLGGEGWEDWGWVRSWVGYGGVDGGLGVGAVGEVCLTGVGGGVLWLRGSCLSVLFTGLDQRARLIVYSFGEKT